MRSLFSASCLMTALTLGAGHGAAQDTRTVTEPHIPVTCTTLKATIAAPGGIIAEADEHRLDTQRIQNAIDHCEPGKAVVLEAEGNNDVFLSGPLELRSGVTLVVDAHTALVASRDPREFDLSPGTCGVVNEKGHGCKPFILVDHATHSGIMGDGSVDGRGGAPLLGEKVSWWDLAHQAKVTDKQQSVPWLVIARHADGFTLYRITLRNSPMFHVSVGQTDGFTAWGVRIIAPKTARNTDGIDPGSSSNVTITHCFIHTGDDNVAVKSSPAGPASHISVVHNHFYTGHGMSIGSGTNGGVDHLLVDDLTIDGADNGIRIKSDRSRGGLVHDAVYQDICIRNTRNPLLFTPAYANVSGDQIPVYRDITLKDIHIESAGTYTLQGFDQQHELELHFDNVFADDQQASHMLNKHARITLGPRRGNLVPIGEDVVTQTLPGSKPGTPLACGDRYVPFPDTDSAPEMVNPPDGR